ncbi:hypothetical protein ACIPSE_10555 [Streptomyces sp. NPDC090106]|uniref:hypothetical protein n=1 Tax=Streptomyces sp. NPDC090106 TaxID=3365946 RepID=UPI003820560B
MSVLVDGSQLVCLVRRLAVLGVAAGSLGGGVLVPIEPGLSWTRRIRWVGPVGATGVMSPSGSVERSPA